VPFVDSLNKQTIRRTWDRPILAALRDRKQEQLSYLGLTGPEMCDILDWRDLLSDDVTAIEEVDFEENLSRMNTVAMNYGVAGHLEVLRGRVEDLAYAGLDFDERWPPLSQIENGYRYFYYDIVNLDFDGGLGNKLARLRAIQELLRRQSRIESTLLITFNVRHRLQKAVSTEIAQLETRVHDPAAAALLKWYAAADMEAFRVKAVVPGVITHYANAVQLSCRAYPPVFYEGHERAQLIHFVFDLAPAQNEFRGKAALNEAGLLGLPLMQAFDSRIDLFPQQAPGTDLGHCESQLRFLGAEAALRIINRFNSQQA
jgi:hypothetical protein